MKIFYTKTDFKLKKILKVIIIKVLKNKTKFRFI